MKTEMMENEYIKAVEQARAELTRAKVAVGECKNSLVRATKNHEYKEKELLARKQAAPFDIDAKLKPERAKAEQRLAQLQMYSDCQLIWKNIFTKHPMRCLLPYKNQCDLGGVRKFVAAYVDEAVKTLTVRDDKYQRAGRFLTDCVMEDNKKMGVTDCPYRRRGDPAEETCFEGIGDHFLSYSLKEREHLDWNGLNLEKRRLEQQIAKLAQEIEETRTMPDKKLKEENERWNIEKYALEEKIMLAEGELKQQELTVARSEQELAMNDPALIGFQMPMQQMKPAVWEAMRRRAAQRYTLSKIALMDFNGQWVFKDWQQSCEHFNWAFNNVHITGGPTLDRVNRLTLQILLAFPVGSVHVHMVDLGMTGAFATMLSRIDSSLCSNIISTSQLADLLKLLEDHVESAARISDNIGRYNEQQQRIVLPYQLVVIPCDGYTIFKEHNTGERLTKLLKSGWRFGIHFIFGTPLPDELNEYYIKYFDKNPFDGICYDMQGCIDYLNDTLKRQQTASLLQPSMKDGSLFAAAPEPVVGEIAIPFGQYANGQTAECIFNDAHPQAILIGQTGSGKSYFMHILLLGAMLRYSSDYLHIYLMDFKLGAPELIGYRDYPHVHSLLADGSDRKIVYEVLRGLFRDMTARGKQISARGCRNIVEYNASLGPGEKPMPRILLVVDECHNLFQSDTANRQLQDQITDIMERIAAEGRSQGVHFLLGTQTLAGTDIPQKVINNVSNRFLMKCSETDADRLADKGSAKVRELRQGMVYHSVPDQSARIFNYAPFTSQAREAIMQKNPQPQPAARFVFTGKQLFAFSPNTEAIDRSRHLTLQLGKEISTALGNVTARLKRDRGENLLVAGINTEMQGERIVYGALLSAWFACRRKGEDVHITLIDNYDEDDDNYSRRSVLLQLLEERCHVSVVTGRRRKDQLLRLSDMARSGADAGHTELLVILGLERMGRLLDEPLADDEALSAEPAGANRGREMFSTSPLRTIGSARHTARRSGNVSGELRYLLENGPENRIYSIVQTTRPSALMPGENNITRSELVRLFCHIAMLQMSDREAVTRLPVGNISLERLSADCDRLRALYYNDNTGGEPALFTPYTLPTPETLTELE